jgi:hypothetical protein
MIKFAIPNSFETICHIFVQETSHILRIIELNEFKMGCEPGCSKHLKIIAVQAKLTMYEGI